jgi:hypothetical protein
LQKRNDHIEWKSAYMRHGVLPHGIAGHGLLPVAVEDILVVLVAAIGAVARSVYGRCDPTSRITPFCRAQFCAARPWIEYRFVLGRYNWFTCQDPEPGNGFLTRKQRNTPMYLHRGLRPEELFDDPVFQRDTK